MKDIQIASGKIGPKHSCFIIAEAGSNHNGELETAKELIKVAAEAGADAVKFQNFKAAKIYPRTAGKSDYLKSSKSIYRIIEEMEMPDEWVPELAGFCRQQGIIFCSSPFDEDSADLLEPYVPFFKIASYEMTHVPLVRHVAGKGKPMIISTGTADLEEVKKMVEVVRETGNDQLALMQCTAKYPAPLEALNIGAIPTMIEEFGLPVGLSDHSRDPIIGPVAAIGAGAAVIEKHFTLSNDLPGPDHIYALEPDELRQMVAAIRQAEAAMGTGEKKTLQVEKELRDFARRYIFTTRQIRRGEEFTPANLAILRKGKLPAGLPPERWESVLGKRAARDIEIECPVIAADIED